MTISRDPRNNPPGPVMAVRFAAIPVVLLLVHGAPVATVSGRLRERGPRPRPRDAGNGRVPARRRRPRPRQPLPTCRGPRAAHQHRRRPDHSAGGDRITYTALVQNSGARRSPPLKITQTLPPGLRFISASRHGVARGGNRYLEHGPARRRPRHVQPAGAGDPVGRPAVAAGCRGLRGPGGQPHAHRLRRSPGPAAGAQRSTPDRRAASPGARTLPSYTVGVLAVLAAAVLAILAGFRIRVRRRRAG